jgi:hypothetical protein
MVMRRRNNKININNIAKTNNKTNIRKTFAHSPLRLANAGVQASGIPLSPFSFFFLSPQEPKTLSMLPGFLLWIVDL